MDVGGDGGSFGSFQSLINGHIPRGLWDYVLGMFGMGSGNKINLGYGDLGVRPDDQLTRFYRGTGREDTDKMNNNNGYISHHIGGIFLLFSKVSLPKSSQ